MHGLDGYELALGFGGWGRGGVITPPSVGHGGFLGGIEGDGGCFFFLSRGFREKMKRKGKQKQKTKKFGVKKTIRSCPIRPPIEPYPNRQKHPSNCRKRRDTRTTRHTRTVNTYLISHVALPPPNLVIFKPSPSQSPVPLYQNLSSLLFSPKNNKPSAANRTDPNRQLHSTYPYLV